MVTSCVIATQGDVGALPTVPGYHVNSTSGRYSLLYCSSATSTLNQQKLIGSGSPSFSKLKQHWPDTLPRDTASSGYCTTMKRREVLQNLWWGLIAPRRSILTGYRPTVYHRGALPWGLTTRCAETYSFEKLVPKS